jgi:hypothetical protein
MTDIDSIAVTSETWHDTVITVDAPQIVTSVGVTDIGPQGPPGLGIAVGHGPPSDDVIGVAYLDLDPPYRFYVRD